MICDLLEIIPSGESNVTRKQYYRFIRMFFRWCVRFKYIGHDPTDALEKIVVKKPKVKILPPNEIERLLRLVEEKCPSLLAYYCLTIFAGMRPSEAAVAKWEHLHFEAKDIEVMESGKTGSRSFSLRKADNLWEWLNYIKENRPDTLLNPEVNHENLQKKVRAGFGDGWIQDGLRHCFGSYYYKLNHDLEHLVYVMGNSVGIAKRHYVNRGISDKVCQEYWAMKPETVLKEIGSFGRILTEENSAKSEESHEKAQISQ